MADTAKSSFTFKGTVLKRYVGWEKNITIPSCFTEIDNDAFNAMPMDSEGMPVIIERLRAVEDVVIPNSIVRIGENAFLGCDGLKSVVLPSGLKEIEKHTFFLCSIETIDLPRGLLRIGTAAFTGSWLKEITFPDTLVSIAAGAFSACKHLEKVVVPNSVNEIAEDAFDHCPLLTIYTPKGSYAESYARRKNIPLENIGTSDSSDSRINAHYASLIKEIEAIGAVGKSESFADGLRESTKTKQQYKAEVKLAEQMFEQEQECAIEEMIRAQVERVVDQVERDCQEKAATATRKLMRDYGLGGSVFLRNKTEMLTGSEKKRAHKAIRDLVLRDLQSKGFRFVRVNLNESKLHIYVRL